MQKKVLQKKNLHLQIHLSLEAKKGADFSNFHYFSIMQTIS